jgi:hypothetical protein
MVQTAEEYSIDDFNYSRGLDTDRAMAYLVPSQNGSTSTDVSNNIPAASTPVKNFISAKNFAKSNDKTYTKVPFVVDCDDNVDYACSATIGLPNPVGGTRNDDTFIFVVGLPYGKPQTTFLLEFLCGEEVCKSCNAGDDSCNAISSGDAVNLKGVQLEVDSTGRANDLYRRLSVRMDNRQDYSLSLLGPLELLNDGSNESLVKDYTVLQEYNFFP